MSGKLLVTGYSGFVGGSVVKQAGQAWKVTAISRTEVANGRPDIEHVRFDLRESKKLQQLFQQLKPDAVIHTAALADIDYCQSHQNEAEETNVGVTRVLVKLCAQHNCRFVFCSTDTVFDGIKGHYTEEDSPNPVNFYAETKVRAEQLVLESSASTIVARLSLVIGLPMLSAGNSFLARMVASFKAGTPVRVPENEIRTPVDVITLGRALLELAGSQFTGIVHLGGNTRLNRYEMALQIAERLGFPSQLVEATNSNAMPGRAPRPNDASLENSKARRLLQTPMQSLADALNLILNTTEN